MTSAGNGAREQQAAARRRVEDAERQLAAARAREHAWTAGADGEEQVADALAGLEQQGWVALHDVAWPGRARANLDHVLVGPGGVLVVDTKNWSGTVTADEARGLKCNGYRKTKEVQAVGAARLAVLPLVPAAAQGFVTGVICLAAQDQAPVRLDGGTVVVGRTQLQQHVLDLPVVLSPQIVMETAVALGESLRRPVDMVPAQASRGTRPSGGARTRKGRARSTGVDLITLAVLAVLIAAFLLFPDQVIAAYMQVVQAVIAPITENLVEDLQNNMAPTPAP